MCKKIILYIILVLILLFNLRLAKNVETYCTGANEISNTSVSTFYTGFQDGVTYVNNNIVNPSLSGGIDAMNYNLTNEDGVCKKYGFEQGFSMYSDARDKQKQNVLNDKFSLTSIIKSTQ